MISIIVPVYNVEQYLRQCLDSLLEQTYRDIEIVCINDGSTDASAGILAGYSLKDTRIRVVTQENRGISAARNRGIEESNGEWLMFVDSDDWTDTFTCETVMQAAADHNADVVFWSYTREFEDGRQMPRPLLESDKVFEGEQLRLLHRKIVGPVGEELRDPTLLHSWGTVWGKLYKREVIGATRFTDTCIVGSAEDVLLNIEVFAGVGKAVYINRPMYHYRKRNVSFTGGYNEMLNERWQNLYGMMADLIKTGGHSVDFIEALDNRIALGLIGQGLNECKSSRNNAAKINNIRQIISLPGYSRAIESLPIQYFPQHWKLFFWAAKKKKAYLLFALIRMIVLLR